MNQENLIELQKISTPKVIALSLTNLLVYTGMGSKAPKYCEIAIECPDERIKKRAVKVWEALGR